MKILYLGDIMARPGIDTVAQLLPNIKATHKPDLILAQAENVSDGKSMTLADMHELQALGIDFFTGGNHTPKNPELHDALKDPNMPVIGPANMTDCSGDGWKILPSKQGDVLVVSLLGATVGREIDSSNPLHKIDEILERNKDRNFIARIVNFHGDFSSEKRIIGYYLDGKVSMVIGDHWHVPTADAMVLPKGTAHMTDVGMCGSLHSSLGVTFDSVVPRWRDGKLTKNELSLDKPWQLNAAFVDLDSKTGLVHSIEHIQQIIA
jgi:metallophosphoesterase (TIGR00282 family)